MGELRAIMRGLRRRMAIGHLPRIKRLLLGDDAGSLNRQLAKLAGRVDHLTRALELLIDSPQNQWLYKHRSERMDATHELFDAQRRQFHLARYQFATRYVVGEVVADIACGTGYGAELLLRQGESSRVIGVDCDPKTVEYARAKHMPAGVEFRCGSGDATDIPDESIDTVVSFETIEHLPSDTALLREFGRILRPNGRLIISTPNQWPLESAPHHVRSYDRTSFEAALSAGFSQIEMYNQNSGNNGSGGATSGIRPTTVTNAEAAECYIAVCLKSGSAYGYRN